MILLKDKSVIFDGLAPEMLYGLGVAASLKHRMYGLNCVVTSLLDGKHNPGSLHPIGKAADLRAHDLKDAEAVSWFQAIKTQLEPMGFDVVIEHIGSTTATTAFHIHIEYDPHGKEFWNISQ